MRSLVLAMGLASCPACATETAPPAQQHSAPVAQQPAPTAEPAPPPAADVPAPLPRDDGLHSPWRADVVDVAPPDMQPVAVERLAVGRHQEFDRLVIHLRGVRMPGHHIEYIDRPVRACGSGEVLPLAGDGWLAVRIEPARVGKAATPPVGDLEVVEAMVKSCDDDGRAEWVLGVASPNRYRAAMLEAPLRLVVDVAHR